MLAGIKTDLEDRLKKPVDIVTYTDSMNSFLKKRIDNEAQQLRGFQRIYPVFEQFAKDGYLEKLFAGYYSTYLGMFPAQAWDKINENFVRCTFYELCMRYHSWDFTFSMEVNYPSGRSDWEMTGKYHTKYKDTKNHY